MKENYKNLSTAIFFIISLSYVSFSGYLLVKFINKPKIIPLDTKNYQTNTYYNAAAEGIDLSLKDTDVLGSFTFTIFNVNADTFLCVLDSNKVMVVDRNEFCRLLNKLLEKHWDPMCMFFARIMEIGCVMPVGPIKFIKHGNEITVGKMNFELWSNEFHRIYCALLKSEVKDE